MATKETLVQQTPGTPIPGRSAEGKKVSISFASYQEDYVGPQNWEIPWLAGEEGFISWDDDNLYPQFLLTLYANSPTHGSIVNGKVNHIVGRGMSSKAGNKRINKFISQCNRKGDSLEDIWRKVVLDDQIFGGFALKVIWNKARTKIVEIYYVDISKYRFNIPGDRLKYSKNWDQWHVYKQQTLAANKSNFNINATIEYLFNTDPDAIKESGGEQIFYYKGTRSRTLYPRPEYEQGINPIITDVEVANYHRANIQAGMFPNMTVQTFTGLPSDDERKETEKAFMEKFARTDKAGGVVFIYNEPGQEPAKVDPIIDSASDQKFQALSKQTQDKIYGIHLCSPSVFGISQEGKLGDNQQLKAAYDNFRKLVVEPKQREIITVLNRLLNISFKDCDITVKPIPQLLNYFTVERIISANMTNEEVRESLVDSGYIETAKLNGSLTGDKNIPNLNYSDKALAIKNLATAQAALPGQPLPTLDEDLNIDTTETKPEPVNPDIEEENTNE
jgi:hypothetical protein